MNRSTLALLLLAWTTAASAAPILRTDVEVKADVVTLGDLIEDVGPNAVVPVFRAPNIGTAGPVAAAHIVEIARKHGVTQIDTRGLSEVMVRRASRAIPLAEFEEQIATRIANTLGLSDSSVVAVTFDKDARTAHVEPNNTGDLVLTRFNHEPNTGRFEAEFDVTGSIAVRQQRGIRLSGLARETFSVIVPTRAIARGETFKAGDLVVERRLRTDGQARPRDAVLSLAEADGKAAKRPLQSGRPLRADDMMRPEIIDKNAAVLIVYELPGMAITVRGKALEAGAKGDTIEVMNLQSKKNLQAVVLTANKVLIPNRGPRTSISDLTPVAAASPKQIDTE